MIKQNPLLKGIRLYSKKEFEGLSDEQKDKHRGHVINKISENATEGISAPEISRLVDYLGTKKTIQRYLDKLVNTNVSYKKIKGNTIIYYHNGRLLHQVLEENIPIGKKIYSFIHMKNPDGEFISIQEKKKNEYDTLILSGGIIIDKDAFPNFIEHIQNINKIVTDRGR